MANHRWGMVIDLDRCTGCEACVAACWAENNIRLNPEGSFRTRRAILWIRIERYWEGEYPNVKARFFPVLCQHCNNAPCEPVCPVFAIYHSSEGLNVQIYNRCVGTRYCANNCPYQMRFFNWFELEWPETYFNQLNPDVIVRTRGLIEKCTFCIQRINRVERQARFESRAVREGEIQPACAQTCPTDALVFGDLNDPNSKASKLAADSRHYRFLEDLGTDPNVIYLKRVEA